MLIPVKVILNYSHGIHMQATADGTFEGAASALTFGPPHRFRATTVERKQEKRAESMVPMRVEKTSKLSLNREFLPRPLPRNQKEALHEPNRAMGLLSSPSPPEEEREKTQWACDHLAPSPREERAGRGLGRGAAPEFMVPMHAKNQKEAFHKPAERWASSPQPSRAGEDTVTAAVPGTPPASD